MQFNKLMRGSLYELILVTVLTWKHAPAERTASRAVFFTLLTLVSLILLFSLSLKLRLTNFATGTLLQCPTQGS